MDINLKAAFFAVAASFGDATAAVDYSTGHTGWAVVGLGVTALGAIAAGVAGSTKASSDTPTPRVNQPPTPSSLG